MKKSRRGFVVALAIMLAAVAVPAFAAEPMTISGVWEVTDKAGTKIYYYFSPGGASGTAVGVISGTDELGQPTIMPIHATWDFEEKDGKQLFCVYRLRVMVNGNWVPIDTNMPGQAEYRFTTENGTQKMFHGTEGEGKGMYNWTKIGTKLTDLPELGPLGYKDATGGRFWAQNGVVVK